MNHHFWDDLLISPRCPQANLRKGLVIVAIKCSSAAARWNESGNAHLELGHAILEVNGLSHRNAMLREFRRNRRVEMLVDPEPNPHQIAIFQEALRRQQKTKAIDVLLQEVTAPVVVETCAICHDDMDGKERHEVRLPCSHRFHQKCVKEWFLSGCLRCPLCNHDLAEDLCVCDSQ